LISVFFPVSRFEQVLEKFLLSITMVFVPIFTVVLYEFFFKKQKFAKPVNWANIIIVFIGITGNWIFNKYSVFVPTLMTFLLVSALFFMKRIIYKN
jgi:purine-cytosine permease-like protein